MNYKSLYSHCNCTITTRFTGILHFALQNCRTDIFILNHTNEILLPCKDKRISLKVNVVEGDKLYTFSKEINKSLTESAILSQKTLIFARMYKCLLSISWKNQLLCSNCLMAFWKLNNINTIILYRPNNMFVALLDKLITWFYCMYRFSFRLLWTWIIFYHLRLRIGRLNNPQNQSFSSHWFNQSNHNF